MGLALLSHLRTPSLSPVMREIDAPVPLPRAPCIGDLFGGDPYHPIGISQQLLVELRSENVKTGAP